MIDICQKVARTYTGMNGYERILRTINHISCEPSLSWQLWHAYKKLFPVCVNFGCPEFSRSQKMYRCELSVRFED